MCTNKPFNWRGVIQLAAEHGVSRAVVRVSSFRGKIRITFISGSDGKKSAVVSSKG
jgi:hypothetical protein